MNGDEKPSKKDVMSMGRVYGSIAKANPELWQRLDEIARVTGRKKHEVIAEALDEYFFTKEMELAQMTPRQLMISFKFFTQLMELISNFVLSFTSQFWLGGLTGVANMLDAIQAQREEQRKKLIEEALKSYEPEEVRAMRMMVMQSMMPLIVNVLAKIVGNLAGGGESSPSSPPEFGPSLGAEEEVVFE